MIFYLSIGAFVVSLIFIITTLFFYNENNFWYDLHQYARTSVLVTGVIFAACLCVYASAHFTEDKDRMRNQETYKNLLWKAEHIDEIEDEFSFNRALIIEDIENWNRNLAEYRGQIENKWVSVFYAKTKYDGTDYIDYNLMIKLK